MLALTTFLDRVSKPMSLTSTQPNWEFDLIWKKNKAILTLQIINLIAASILYFIRNQDERAFSLYNVLTSSISLSVVMILCRSHPLLLNALIALLSALYSIFYLYLFPDSVIRLIVMGIMIPVYQVYLIHDRLVAFLSCGFQVYFLCTQVVPHLMSLHENHYPKMIYELGNSAPSWACFISILVLLMDQSGHRAEIDLIKLKEEVAEKMRLFFLSFSHEIRNPINSIVGNIQLALLETLNPSLQSILKSAKISGDLLVHIINNILDRGKLEIDDLEINPSEISVPKLISNHWQLASELIKRKGLKGQMLISKLLPQRLTIDAYRLEQMLLNLITNALKFTEIGEISIEIQWIPGYQTVHEKCFFPAPYDDTEEGIFEKDRAFTKLSFGSWSSEHIILTENKKTLHSNELSSKYPGAGILKICVSDTGCGMNTETIKKLFKGSLNANSSTTLKTGLGLYITASLCKKMNGEIRAYSKEGKGSSFVMCIPAFSSFRVVSDPKDILSYIKERPPRALVVDDEVTNCLMMKKVLNKLGITDIVTCNNGRQAFEEFLCAVEHYNFYELVFMDLNMPVMDGKTSAKLIRELETQKKIRKCFLGIVSGNCGDSEHQDCMDKLGPVQADHFFKKPLAFDKLTEVLSQHFIYQYF